MKKYFFALPLFVFSFLLSGCQLPTQLAQFDPGQMVNKTMQSAGDMTQPSPQPILEPLNSLCTDEGCSIDEEGSEAEIDVANPKRNGEPAIRAFFELINGGNIEEAVDMMSDFAVPDQPTYNAWLDNFDSLNSVVVKTIEPYSTPSWTSDRELYLVVVDLQTSTGQEQYGWAPGENTRWIEAVKNSTTSVWEINSINTGP